MTKSLLRVVVLASGFGSNLQVIINHAKEGTLSAEVVAVVSDKKQSFALERARKENIKAVFVNPRKFADREKYRRGSKTEDRQFESEFDRAGRLYENFDSSIRGSFQESYHEHSSLVTAQVQRNQHSRTSVVAWR